MFPNTYFARSYFPESYFPPIIDVEIPLPGPRGGGGSGPSTGENYYNQKPPVVKDKEMYLAQALQEDEELIILIKAFAEVIQWH